MDPVQLNLTVGELTRMTAQVSEHNHSDGNNNITMCICRECDTVRAFNATTPILSKLQSIRVLQAVKSDLSELLQAFIAGLEDDESDEPTEENDTADETPTGDETADGWCPFCRTVHGPAADEKVPAAE